MSNANRSQQFVLPAVYESLEDAVRDVVRALGGTKKVAGLLWPAKAQESPGAAERQLLDCLNPDRPHKLSPAELLMLARWGREEGCHAIAQVFCDRSGYATPQPVAPEDELAALQRRTIEAVSELKLLIQRQESITNKHGGAG